MNNVAPHVYEKEDVEEVLPLVDAPYLPQINEEEQKNTYTLVLDLDETLVHFFEVTIQKTETEGHVLVRPGAEKFIEEMGEIYELVIFTAAIQEYADKVINEIDSKNRVKFRLYRQHAIPQENNFIKVYFIQDLTRIGRDLSKIIIVDNTQECFQLQPENGICIRSWFGDNNDNALDELSELLKGFFIKR